MTDNDKRLITIVVPAFNEEAILSANLQQIARFMDEEMSDYGWEMIIVNDGSADRTAELADEYAETRNNVRVVHFQVNRGLGQAMAAGFRASRGDYVVVMDADLSYDTEHIRLLVERLENGIAKVVVASPYVPGGRTSHIPFLRRVLSIAGNRFLKALAPAAPSTITSMVRAYDGPFVRTLNLRCSGMEVMPEIIYKTIVLRERIDEVPAHLDWGFNLRDGVARQSSMRILGHTIFTVLAGFIFRPFLFFVLPGLAMLVFAAYCNMWMFIHFLDAYRTLSSAGLNPDFGDAVGLAYADAPHTFVVGLFALVLGILLIGLGSLSLQCKRYFEETFHFQTRLLREAKGPTGEV